MKLKPLLNSFVVLSSTLALVLALRAGVARGAEAVDYAAKVAPIFEARCVDCHAGEDGVGDFSL
jgi:mono/diheme cytochrome c family protein